MICNRKVKSLISQFMDVLNRDPKIQELRNCMKKMMDELEENLSGIDIK